MKSTLDEMLERIVETATLTKIQAEGKPIADTMDDLIFAVETVQAEREVQQ